MKNTFTRLQSLWQVRSPSEKRALAALAAVLLIALAGQLLWTLQQSRQQLRQQLPRLATAAENMRQQLLVWQSLSAGAAKAPPPLAQEEISRRLSGVDGKLKISWRGEEQLAVSGEVAFDAWLKEIGELQRDYRLLVTRLQALPAGTGRVALEAELARNHAP
jgi:type II secretory pathway component PulM